MVSTGCQADGTCLVVVEGIEVLSRGVKGGEEVSRVRVEGRGGVGDEEHVR